MSHATHTMHQHSLAAYHTTDFGERAMAVLGVYLATLIPLADREVMARLGFTDANAVRPRITEWPIAGYLAEAGKTKDPVTGKTVRLCVPTSLARRLT